MMNVKVHYLLTAIALVFLGFSISNGDILQQLQGEDRTCNLIMGNIDCVSNHADYKINHAEVINSLN
ncbi:MAG TPA: hypothetical protein VNJ08_16830 [Bacteriovoracaceae bacterium]|nr:hypothetical protein [Bacteriovoracaceae bacterium]